MTLEKAHKPYGSKQGWYWATSANEAGVAQVREAGIGRDRKDNIPSRKQY